MGENRLLQGLRRRRYLLLLVSLLLLAVLDPVIEGQYVGSRTFDTLLCIVLLAVVFALSQRKRPLLAALVLGIPALLATWSVYVAADSPGTAHIGVVAVRHIVHFLFLAMATSLILYDVFQSRQVTGDTICGAMCVFLLIGVTWSLLYALTARVDPQAFSVPAQKELSFYLYYSFVTLSTLGYGDITPVSAPTRVLSWFEAVTGELYLAVLIARLVGLHIVHSREE